MSCNLLARVGSVVEMNRWKHYLIGIGCGFLLAGCGDSDSGGPQGGMDDVDPPYVEVVQSQLGSLPLQQRLSGVVHARNQVTIYPEIAGRVVEVYVDNGERVAEGEPLVRLDARQVEEQLKQAEAQLRVQQAAAEQAQARLHELEVELSLTEQLAGREFISELEITRLRAQVEAARADYNRARAVVEGAESTVEERRWQLSQAVVRSPIDGLVGRRNAEIGMRADTSTDLFVVGDLSQVQVRLMITERMMRSIEVGDRAQIRSEYFPDTVIEAELSRISPFLRQGSFSTEAAVDVPNPDGLLRSGMYVDVDIFYGGTDPTTLIPTSALREDPRTGRFGVYWAPEIDGGERLPDTTQIEYKEVSIIGRGRTTVGISGIPAGGWVVAVGHDLLSERAAREAQTARIRELAWDRLISMQELQEGDVLRQFMQRQQQSRASSSNP